MFYVLVGPGVGHLFADVYLCGCVRLTAAGGVFPQNLEAHTTLKIQTFPVSVMWFRSSSGLAQSRSVWILVH